MIKNRSYTSDEPVGSENLDKYRSHRDGSKGVLMNSNATLGDYITNWMVTVKRGKVKESTYDRLTTSVTTLMLYPIHSLSVSEITPEDCEEYVDQLTARGYSLTTIKKQMQIVSAPLRYAYTHRVIPFNPAACMKPPSKTNIQKAKKKVDAYSPDEQEALRNVLRQREYSASAAIELMLETGMRPGEVLAFEKEDINLEKKYIYVHRTMINLANRKKAYIQNSAKSDTSNRRVPLSPRAQEIASVIVDAQRPYPFRGWDGDRLSYEGMRYQCIQICKKAGVQYKGLHVFRHTFATNMFYKGVNVKILSQILGHSELSVTMNIYIHLYGDGFDEMLAAVG